MSKTRTKNRVQKNYNHNKKEMSFLKISDPTKRDAMVKDYLDLKRNIRDNLLSERTGEQLLQTNISKFLPITETQKATAREITVELKPIKEGIKNLPNIITFPAYPSIRASSEPLEEETDRQYIAEVAANALGKYITKDEADRTFGIYDKDNKFYIGDRHIKIKGNDIEVLDKSGFVEKKI